MKQIPRYSHVEGVCIYAVKDGQKESNPSAIDVSLNVPELAFETSDIPYMGTMTITDQTRLSNIEISVACEAENPNAVKLFGAGLKEWACVWVESVIAPDGSMDVVGYTVNCKGFVSSVPDGSKEVGSQATCEYKMNCIAIKKTDSNNNVYYDIDRSQGLLVVNGTNLREKVNSLLDG